MSAGEFQQQHLFTVFGHILLTGCLIDTIFPRIHNFERVISMLLVGVFITFLQGFSFGV
jgi:cell shape-determining protein MreD